jgi:hypothetical protein
MGEGTRISIFIPREQGEKEKQIKKRAVTGMLKLPDPTPSSQIADRLRNL